MNAVWPWPEQLEGIVAAPASHRILLETPALRVLEIVIEPGARKPEHVHRHSSVMIVDRPALIRYYESGRLTFESEETVGEPVARAMWMNPEGLTRSRTSIRAATAPSVSKSSVDPGYFASGVMRLHPRSGPLCRHDSVPSRQRDRSMP